METKGSLCPTCWSVWLGMNVSGDDCYTYNMGALRYESIAATNELDKEPGPCVTCGKVNTLSRIAYVKEYANGVRDNVHALVGSDGSVRSSKGKVNPMFNPKMGEFWWVSFEIQEGPVMSWRREDRLVYVGLDEQLMESDADDEVFFTCESVEQFVNLDFQVDNFVPKEILGKKYMSL